MLKRVEYLAIYTFVVVSFTCVVTLLGTYILRDAFKDDDQQADEITNDVVIEKITDQAFLVTQTVYTDQSTRIEIDQGSAWSNFWWGRSVTAEGRVRTDYGIDFTKLDEKQIRLDQSAKTISINTIQPEILDSSVTTDLEITAGGSLLRRLLKQENNQDYKLAAAKLTEAASRAVVEDPQLQLEAKQTAAKLLTRLFAEQGYEVVIE